MPSTSSRRPTNTPAVQRRPRAPSAKSVSTENWSISFKYVDSFSGMDWPGEAELVHFHILAWLFKINMIPWVTLENTSREDGKPQLQRCDVSTLGSIARNRIEELSRTANANDIHIVVESDWLHEFTYCHRRNDPRRLWGVYLEGVFHVVWWDSNHSVSGSSMAVRNTKPCESDCLHPVT
jgi:hypothetical protein